MNAIKKTSKMRLLSLLLVLCMVATLLPVMSMTAQAAEPIKVAVSFKSQDVNGNNLRGSMMSITGSNITGKFILMDGDASPVETVELGEGTFTIRHQTVEKGYKLAGKIEFSIDSNGVITSASTECKIEGNTIIVISQKINNISKDFLWDIAEKGEEYTANYKGANGVQLRIEDVSAFNSHNVAYCLNKEMDFPKNEKYLRIKNGLKDEKVVKAVLSNPDKLGDIGQVQKMVKNSLYAGYPYDGLGLGKKNYYQNWETPAVTEPLDDRELEFLTQVAVWEYTDKYQNVFPLTYGNELKELTLSDDYEVDIFIPKDKKSLSQNLAMMIIKQEVTILKVDDNGQPLSKAVLVLTDADGNKVGAWETDGNGKQFKLRPGEYTLEETTAPQGYETINKFSFKVNGDGSVAVADKKNNDITTEKGKLTIKDVKLPTVSGVGEFTVPVNKVVEVVGTKFPGNASFEFALSGNGKELSAFGITMTKSTVETVADKTTTDVLRGNVDFSKVREENGWVTYDQGATYTAQLKLAEVNGGVDGWTYSPTEYAVEIHCNLQTKEVLTSVYDATKGDYVDKAEFTNTYTNKQTQGENTSGSGQTTSPQTGDNSNMLLWIALLLTSCGGIATTCVVKRKRVCSK